MATVKTKRIDIGKSCSEWKAFDRRIVELNRKNSFNSYVNNKVHSLIKDYTNCPDCVIAALKEKTKKRSHYSDLDNYEILLEISKAAKIPVATILDRIIINSLIIEK